MTKIKFISIVAFFLLATSCGKKTRVKGVVYSKNNIPVPNVDIECRYYKSSSYPYPESGGEKTNSAGEFDFEYKPSRRHSHEIKVWCDSGYAKHYIETGKLNNIDLHLE